MCTSSRSDAVTSTSSRCRSTWLGRSPSTASNSAIAVGIRSGCATHVPSKPSPASRFLSAATFSNARCGDLGVAAVRDEGAHAADREGAALVARLHEQLGVGPHERHRHRDLAAVGQHEPRAAAAVVLDDREDVVPAAGVQARAVVAQLEEDLLHLERRRQGLDQHRRADRAVRDADVLLAEA